MTRSQRVFAWLGGACFVGSLGTCAYSYLFVWGRSRDGLGLRAVLADAGLLAIFALHHSLFARDAIKARIARIVPRPLMRSVYVWTASLLFIAVCAGWRAVGSDFYDVGGSPAWLFAAVQLAGVGLIAASVRRIDPLELAGIRQQAEAQEGPLQMTGPYRLVRHPLYLGWMLAVFGAAHMTGDRLAFAAISSIYLVIAIPWEERSLARSLGAPYEAYARRVRWRVVPYLY